MWIFHVLEFPKTKPTGSLSVDIINNVILNPVKYKI